MNTRWLSIDQQRSWRLFLRASAQVLEDINHDLGTRDGLSLSEYEVLVRLSESPGWVRRMSSLAEDLVYSRSRLTHTVRRLEQDGYVERSSTSEDRRGVNARLTDAGHARLKQAAPGHVEAVRLRLVDRLTDEQMHTLGEIMAALLEDDEVAIETRAGRPPLGPAEGPADGPAVGP